MIGKDEQASLSSLIHTLTKLLKNSTNLPPYRMVTGRYVSILQAVIWNRGTVLLFPLEIKVVKDGSLSFHNHDLL